MKAEVFLSLSPDERTEALQVAASKSGRPLHVLEKDVWVVWTLSALFEAPFGKHRGTGMLPRVSRLSLAPALPVSLRKSSKCVATPRISFRSPFRLLSHVS
jgi:hypothetical protein